MTPMAFPQRPKPDTENKKNHTPGNSWWPFKDAENIGDPFKDFFSAVNLQKISVGIFQGGHAGGGGWITVQAKEHILKLNGSSIQFLRRITFGLQTFNLRHLGGCGTRYLLGSGLVDVAFSRGLVSWLVDIISPGKIRKEGMDFWGGIENAEFFDVFFEVGKMFEAHKVTIFWPLRIRKPLKTGCLQGPDPCYTGSNTSIAGYLGILRETWIFLPKKNWTTHPSPPCKQVARSISLNMSWQATFAWKPRVVATSFRFGYSPTSTSSQKPGIPTNVIINSVLFCIGLPKLWPKMVDCAQGILTPSF